MTEKFQEIHGAIDLLLQERGEYSPIELLLAEGRLSYADYEGWRCGQIATLDEVLAGNPVRISAMLVQAGQYAALLDLQADRRDFFSWGAQAGELLRLSRDPVFESLCRVHYKRGKDEIQLDLFMDNTANLLTNGIVDALGARRVDEAARLLDLLLDADPSHPRLGALESLCNAAKQLPEPIADCISESEFVETYLVPLATETLGVKARDFLVPFWRRLADASFGQVFHPETPNLHASYFRSRANDWASVKTVILGQEDWQNFPVLRCRLAEAEFYLGERNAALALWCRLCWDFPEEAESLLLGVPNKQLQSAWQRYCELEVEPQLDVQFFPAWLLLERTDMRVALLPEEIEPHHNAPLAYCALHELLASGTALSERTLQLRQKLNRVHPGLFAFYLRKIAGDSD